jgi:hypothetical protein
MGIIVATSKVSDGSMLNRHNILDPTVFENRKKFLENNSIRIEQTTRLRGNYQRMDFLRFSYLEDSFKDKGMLDDEVPIADAIVTTEPNHALFLPIADCVGTVLYDESKHLLAVVHLGRHCLEQQGGQKVVEYLQEQYGVDPSNLQVWLTPAPSKEAYPIWKLDNKGMKEVTFEQLLSAGIAIENITDNAAESDKHEEYFSYSEFLKGHRTKDGDYAIVAMMTD